MSPELGQVYFAREKQSPYLNTPLEGAWEYSQSTAELIDQEVRGILAEQFQRALDILEEKRQVLEKGARLLQEQEKIEGEVLQKLMEEAS